jgi:uncharacterized protein (UPF0548 family)
VQLSFLDAAALTRIVMRLERLDVSYERVGVTLSSAAMETHVVRLGSGQATFETARTALQSWVTHQSSWLRTFPGLPQQAGQTVLVVLKLPGTALGLVFGCKVVEMIDSERHFGFAYGSLPGHPERGEELFLVEWHVDDRVTFTLKAKSDPANLLYRLGRPFGELMRSLGSRQYLKAMQRATRPRS